MSSSQPNLTSNAVTVPVLPVDELVSEADRLIELAEQRAFHLRLLGGLAVYESCPSAQLPELCRNYPDIDFVTDRTSGPATRTLLSECGYSGDQRFNALHGETRLLFYHESGGWQIDVFLGAFSMCHNIDLSRSLFPGRRVIPPADLLLTKLQIVEMNLKDMKDVLAILLDHSVGSASDPEAIDLAHLTEATSKDWGLYTTVMKSLTRVRTDVAHLLADEKLRSAQQRVDQIEAGMVASPKSLRWKLRSRVGTRVLWYELPDEVRQ